MVLVERIEGLRPPGRSIVEGNLVVWGLYTDDEWRGRAVKVVEEWLVGGNVDGDMCCFSSFKRCSRRRRRVTSQKQPMIVPMRRTPTPMATPTMMEILVVELLLGDDCWTVVLAVDCFVDDVVVAAVEGAADIVPMAVGDAVPMALRGYPSPTHKEL